jgi:hypothetical protein
MSKSSAEAGINPRCLDRDDKVSADILDPGCATG